MDVEDDSDVEVQEYDPVEVETSITLNKEVREWNESQDQSRQCVLPVVRTVFSLAAHVGVLVCVGLMLWAVQHGLQPSDSGPDHALVCIIAGVVAAVLYAGILAEAAVSETRRYLKHQVPPRLEICCLERTRDACPMVRWRAVCYHYEAPGSQAADCKGRSVNNRRHREKVVSSNDTEAFQFTKWRDLTRDIRGLFRMPIIRVFAITGFRERLVLCREGSSRPCWLTESIFWLTTLFLLTWPYRLLFLRRSTKVYVVFIKELEA